MYKLGIHKVYNLPTHTAVQLSSGSTGQIAAPLMLLFSSGESDI